MLLEQDYEKRSMAEKKKPEEKRGREERAGGRQQKGGLQTAEVTFDRTRKYKNKYWR